MFRLASRACVRVCLTFGRVAGVWLFVFFWLVKWLVGGLGRAGVGVNAVMVSARIRPGHDDMKLVAAVRVMKDHRPW